MSFRRANAAAGTHPRIADWPPRRQRRFPRARGERILATPLAGASPRNKARVRPHRGKRRRRAHRQGRRSAPLQLSQRGHRSKKAAPPQAAAALSDPAQPQVQEAAAPQLASLPTEPVPLTRMRAIIAERMVESVRTSPHVYTSTGWI